MKSTVGKEDPTEGRKIQKRKKEKRDRNGIVERRNSRLADPNSQLTVNFNDPSKQLRQIELPRASLLAAYVRGEMIV